MKRIIYIICYLCIANTMWSQAVYFPSGSELTVSPGAVVHIGGNLTIDAGATVTIKSDATNSASFIVTGTASGNVTYQRYIPDTDWHLVSAPVVGQNVGSFTLDTDNAVNQGTDNTYAVAYYKNDNNAGSRWTYHTTGVTSAENRETLTNFNSGIGYSTNRTAAGNFSFTGSVATNNVDLIIPKESGTGHWWSCIGNPYASFLPANNPADATSNVLENNISKLDPSFAFLYVWNGAAYVPIGHGDAALQLAPGQAFMVRAKSASETFTFANSLQSHHDDVATFYKNSNTTPTISLNLSDGAQNKSTRIKFSNTASYGLDVGYDAGAYQDGTPSFSIDTHLVEESQGISFTNQFLPHDALGGETVVPLAVNAAAFKNLIFSIATSNVAADVNVYLEDSEANTFTNLTESDYQITLSESINGIGRFYLHTSEKKSLGVEDTGLSTINMYKINENTLRITGLKDQNRASIAIYSITGTRVFDHNFTPKRINDIVIPEKLAAGVYMANVISNNTKFTRRIVIE